MKRYEGEYSGAALQSFLLALGHSQPLVEKLMQSCGIERIDPERWYDIDVACAVYDAIDKQIGRSATVAVGKKMIEAAPFPPGLNDVRGVLSSLGAAYRMNVRGPLTGDIICSFDDERSATLRWTALGPCALNFGIIQGCCGRFGGRALVEHGATGCMERGAAACVYRVSW